MEIKQPRLLLPGAISPAGGLEPLRTMDQRVLRERSIRSPRAALQEGLGLGFLDPGSAHLPDPLFLTEPGRDVPEMRVDGLPVGPVRWPETSLSALPTLALGEVILRPYSPIDSPLSSTGGPLIDIRLAPAVDGAALSAVRLTHASYGTYTEEVALRRSLGPTLVNGFYGDTKTRGHDPWWEQKGQTIGLRISHRFQGGILEWGGDDAFSRFALLSTKGGLWDRTAWALRWQRPDSSATSIESSASWTWTRAGWWTARGLTERRSRSIGLRTVVDRAAGRGRVGVSTELDVARTFVRRPGAARRLLEDVSAGAAVGWSGPMGGGAGRGSLGIERLAPLAVSPVFGAEYKVERAGSPPLSIHASRSVRNRTLPRMPTDGEAWVLQGIGLADEQKGEQPEGAWRAGIVLGRGRAPAGSSLRAGADLQWMTRSLSNSEAELVNLGTGEQSALPSSAQRGDRRYASLWIETVVRLPLRFRVGAEATGVAAEGGVERDLGLPAVRGTGEFAWNGSLFSNDLNLDLAVQGAGRSAAATPYGLLPAQARVDGVVQARIGAVDLFFVLANLTDTISTSMSFDGQFYPLPRRHFRAGVRWSFTD